MITIKVIDEDTMRPVEDAEVGIIIDEFFRMGSPSNEYTDANGEADMDTEPGRGRVFVDGSEVYNGYISSFQRVYI